MPVRFLVKSKAETGDKAPEEQLLSGDKILLGRDKGCAVVLNDPTVSRAHAQLVREGALYFLEDLGSSFGTRVNGAPLPAGEKRLLRNGDVLAVGPFDLTFDRIAEVDPSASEERTAFVAKRAVKDVLRNLSSGAGPCLRVMNGPMEGRRVEVRDAQEIVIGRDESADIRLEGDDLVSRRHAKIRRDWTGTALEDLDSRNGIFVNKKQVTSHPLKDRDEIEVGGTRFLFLDPTEVREALLVSEERPRPARPEPPPEAVAPEEAEGGQAAEEPTDQAEEGGQEDEEPSEEGERLGDAGHEGKEIESHERTDVNQSPSYARQPWSRERVASLLTPEGMRSLAPVLLVAAIALFALGILAVTFFVM